MNKIKRYVSFCLKTVVSAIFRRLSFQKWKEVHKVMDESILKHIADNFFSVIGTGTVNTIFDVGAHAGATSNKFALDFPNAKIFATEPSKKNYDVLVSNTKKNPKIITSNWAFSDKDTEGQFFHSENSQCNSLKIPWKHTGTSETVKIIRIDTFCKKEGINRINILKIDTEGHELEVLKGAKEMLEGGNIDIIYVECGFKPGDTCHSNFFQIANLLCAYNYNVAGFTETSNFMWSDVYTLLYCNAIFVRGQQLRKH